MLRGKAGTQQMSDSGSKSTGVEHAAPPLAPLGINDILRDADVLLELMGKEPLGVVAKLANTLTVSAHEAGARDIEEAASNVRRLASGHGPVALAGAMRALTDAIARTERVLAAQLCRRSKRSVRPLA
jgi:hypothetical protein